VASKKRRIRSPDGREWEVLSYRLRLPRWRQADYEPWDDVSEIRITWRTTSADAENVVDEVARQLELGYGEVNPEHADLLEMTRPPGFEDVDR
jgi:hypothetical protein